MKLRVHEDLVAVLDAVEIQSASRYEVLGEVREVRDHVPGENGSDPGSDELVSALSRDLYDRLYIRPTSRRLQATDPLAQRDLVVALSASDTGHGCWQAGWTIRGIEADGRVAVAKDDVTLWAPGAELSVSEEPLRPGDRCRVWVAKELRGLIPGFYLAVGDSPDDDGGDEELEREVRFYWHLTSDSAVPFMAMATSLLNESQVPFRVKVLNDPNAYHRADAGVMYFRRRDDDVIGRVVRRIHSAVAHGLRPDVPLFTKRLRPGLGLADSPASRASFGEQRCRLVARELWDSFIRHEVERSVRVESLASAFLRAGLDPLRPHLGPGERDDCFTRHFPAENQEEMTDSASVEPAPPSLFSAGPAPAVSMLEAAARIGRTLFATAYWDAECRHCNWVGRTNSQVSDNDSPTAPVSAALGPDVYAGTAGVALFLSQLHALTDDRGFRETALGAIAHSIRQFKEKALREPLSPLSFYSGDLGAAYVAQKLDTQIGHTELVHAYNSILDRVVESVEKPHMLDVIGGNAGAIPVLLAMGRVPGLNRCASLAALLGEELCQVDPTTSGVRGRGWARPPGLELDEFTPSGLSHGASGLGLALLELFAATGRIEFRDAARRSFEYEDTLFEPAQRNWANSRQPSEYSRFDRFWCNGAPGIALARLRAAALDPDRREDYLGKARLAIKTTLDAIDDNLGTTGSDTSLCHGLTGLGEIVLIAGRLLDEPPLHDRSIALAHALIERHSRTGDWPSGTLSGGPNPSLMLGLAGVGYWLLRLHDPKNVPSLLLFVP